MTSGIYEKVEVVVPSWHWWEELDTLGDVISLLPQQELGEVTK